MLDYLAYLWPWLLGCFAIGALSAWFTRRAPRGRFARWLIWAALACGLGVVAAALGALPGVAAAMLESALAAFVLFLLGAALAAILRDCALPSLASGAFDPRSSWRRLRAGGWRSEIGRSLRAHEGWALGLVPVALLWLGAAHFSLPAYQQSLQQRAAAVLSTAGADSSGVTVLGRDLRPSAMVVDNAALMRDLAGLRGMRKLLAPLETAEAVATRENPVRAHAAKKPSDPREILASLPDGPLSLSDCEAALSATTEVDPVAFREKSSVIRRDAARALDKAAAYIRRCPDVDIEVIGRADALGGEEQNSELSLRRASAAARYLRREGVAGRRLIMVGYGAVRPASETEFAVRPQDRSVRFVVKPTM